jgi:hypothetical protein
MAKPKIKRPNNLWWSNPWRFRMIQFHIDNEKHVENLTQFFSPLFPGAIKVFEHEDIEKARSWLI